MNKKFLIRIFLIIFFLSIILIIYKNIKKDNSKSLPDISTVESYNSSNIMKNVNYESIDAKGNEFIIDALEGQIDISDSNTIYLTDVTALIKLNNSNNIKITSDYGKYNINNFNTIFSQNVIITYLDNKITAEYLDLSMERNSMIISRNVVYTSTENILNADVIEVNIKTKDTKILMYEKGKKVKIKSINQNGNN